MARNSVGLFLGMVILISFLDSDAVPLFGVRLWNDPGEIRWEKAVNGNNESVTRDRIDASLGSLNNYR